MERLGSYPRGSISFVVPKVVQNELINLKNDNKKKQEILATLNFIKNFKIINSRLVYEDYKLENFNLDSSITHNTIDISDINFDNRLCK